MLKLAGQGRRRARRRSALAAAVVVAALCGIFFATPLGAGTAHSLGGFSAWLTGQPGLPASKEEQLAFDEASARSRGLPQRGMGSAQRRRDGSYLDAEDVGDRAVVEVGVVAHEERSPLARRQGRDPRRPSSSGTRPFAAGSLEGSIGADLRSRTSLRASLTTIRHSHASSGPAPLNERRLRTAVANACCTCGTAGFPIPCESGRDARAPQGRRFRATRSYEYGPTEVCLAGAACSSCSRSS